MTSGNRVSVIITNYNYGRFLPDCIGSVLAQNFAPIEIVVVDDGSADNSREVLQQFAAQIKIVVQENSGQAAALSAGFAHCSGDIICLLDADDGWYPDKVRAVVNTFDAHPEVKWIRHKLALVTEDLQPCDAVLPPFSGSSAIPPDPVLLIERIVSAGTSLAMRRSLAERVFPLHLDPDMMLDADDTMLLARIFAAGAIGYSLDVVLGFYRRHSSHRFGVDDLGRLLNREACVSTVLARMFASRRKPSVAYKLQVIVAAMSGAPWWDQRRLGNYVHGLRSVVGLWKRPALCARLAAALTFAFVAPSAWIGRLKRTQSFYEAPSETVVLHQVESS